MAADRGAGQAQLGQLIVQLQSGVVQILPILTDRVTIGRAPDNTLVLPLPLVSKYHAELMRVGQGLLITDLESQFGTFVAGVRLQANQPYPLLSGLAVQVGPFVITYRADSVSPAENTEPVSNESEPVMVVTELTQEQSPLPLLDAPLPSGQAKYMSFLPVIFHHGDFMNRYLQIFEALWEPLEWRQQHIDFYFDPRTCPTGMLSVLSAWIGMTPDPRWSEWRHRRILMESAELQRWRGTSYTLSRMIELSTDVASTIVEDPADPFVFTVKLPRGVSERQLEMVRDLVESHKPAHTGYRLEVGA